MKIELIDLASFKQTSYRSRLRQLYHRLDATALGYDLGAEKRKAFFATAQGEFVAILRLKRQVPIETVADFLRMPLHDVVKIEHGELRLDDQSFFGLCARLGGDNEASVFLEKVEKALQPGLREARQTLAPSLRIYGITFADTEL